jgi:hypothetical protein
VQERHQVLDESRSVRKWILLRFRFEKEVERIDDRHFRMQIDLEFELDDVLVEYEPRQIVPVRILLPIKKVLGRLDAQ